MEANPQYRSASVWRAHAVRLEEDRAALFARIADLDQQVRDRAQLAHDRADLLDLLQALVTEIGGMAPPRHGNAPYHSHIIAGVWDGSGEPCRWCHLWTRVKSRLDQLSAEEADP